MTSNFIDYVKIHCSSGKGGAGSAHLRREKFVPRGGPDGGDGGRGGNIIIKGNRNMWTLLHLKYTKHIAAGPGESGGRQQSSGRSGKDIIIELPLGTIAKDAETDEYLTEITHHDQSIILLKGGRGGLGNTHFKTSTHQTPRFAQPGEEGLEQWVVFELKILADVGLVGFPNAGKSTLLSVVSAAKPEIADYPFTTLVPNLGMVQHRDNQSFVMADIPGIIEGAHQGKGLGYRFLRHIERNSVLLFMVAADSPDIAHEYNILISELEKFNPELLDKKRILAISKCDLLDEDGMQKMQNLQLNVPHLLISSHTQKGILQLKDALWKILNH